jgi:hypothetical protein
LATTTVRNLPEQSGLNNTDTFNAPQNISNYIGKKVRFKIPNGGSCLCMIVPLKKFEKRK